MSSRFSIVRFEAHRKPAEDEMRDALELRLARERERDLVSHPVRLSPGRHRVQPSARPRDRARAAPPHPWRRRPPAASCGSCGTTTSRTTHRTRSPASFCTGRLTAKLTVRTASSTASTASTALSVAVSSLSSCAFTRSTEPPTLLITGRTSRLCPSDQRRKPVETLRTGAGTPSPSRDRRPAGRPRAPRRRGLRTKRQAQLASLASRGRGDQTGTDDDVAVVKTAACPRATP